MNAGRADVFHSRWCTVINLVEDDHLCCTPIKYIEKMLSNYKQMFGMLPKDAALPLEKGNHPELDSSDLLDLEGIKFYQSLTNRCTSMGDTNWPI
jgi:hypothetical protein